MVNMKRLDTATRVRIVAALIEGCSVRSVSRMTGVSKNTILKLLGDLGPVCEEFHDRHVRGLQCERIEADEIWSFCYAKDKNLPDHMRDEPGVGSVWTWTALDRDSKLMVSWHVGGRDPHCAFLFMRDLRSRLANRIQLTTDGLGLYVKAVDRAFGWDIDFAQLIKIYGSPSREEQARYSACKCVGTEIQRVTGQPIKEDISTSYVERQNLTMRMGMRRFTRLTNAFSKKFANLRWSVALHFMHYNFCRVHSSLRVTPAMEAGVADHVWDLEELVGLLEAKERAVIGTEANKRGPYRKTGTDSD